MSSDHSRIRFVTSLWMETAAFGGYSRSLMWKAMLLRLGIVQSIGLTRGMSLRVEAILMESVHNMESHYCMPRLTDSHTRVVVKTAWDDVRVDISKGDDQDVHYLSRL